MINILIIDDEKHILDTFEIILSELGYEVFTAGNGKEGLDSFIINKPDLILVDLHMPVMDGLKFMEKMKDFSPETPLVVVSGSDLISDAVQALKLGAWDYLLKPIEDVHIVQNAIEKALERFRLIKENKEYKSHLENMVALRTAQLEETNKQLINTRMQIIIRLGKAAEYRDNDTGKHVIRVSHLSGTLAQKVGLSEDCIELIKICSPMHDIGKIGIPDHILNKQGPLNDEEWEIMQTHSEIGYQMMKPITKEDGGFIDYDDTLTDDSDILQMGRIIAMNHHERWDGSGYPAGKKGEDIPIEARIVTLVDIYDALSCQRPYKPPFNEEKCQKIIKESSGSILDPKLVDLFFQHIDEFISIKQEWAD